MARTGRPRSFDRDVAVATAMTLFWEYGYEGASLEQLRQAMGGISSASFYAAFPSKEALFREVVSRYLESHGRVTEALRDKNLAPRARIETALRRSARMQTEASHPAGCLIALSATIGSQDCGPLRALTAAERALNRAAFRLCIEEAIRTGMLRPDADAAGLATLFDGLLLGLSLMARDGVGHAAMEAAISQALVAWDHAAD